MEMDILEAVKIIVKFGARPNDDEKYEIWSSAIGVLYENVRSELVYEYDCQDLNDWLLDGDYSDNRSPDHEDEAMIIVRDIVSEYDNLTEQAS
jgi:hypothetical protein